MGKSEWGNGNSFPFGAPLLPQFRVLASRERTGKGGVTGAKRGAGTLVRDLRGSSRGVEVVVVLVVIRCCRRARLKPRQAN